MYDLVKSGFKSVKKKTKEAASFVLVPHTRKKGAHPAVDANKNRKEAKSGNSMLYLRR